MRKLESFRLTPAAVAALDARAARGGRGRALSAIIERYALLCERHQPDLSEAEWAAIYDACNGWAAWARPQDVQHVWLEVQDALEDGLADRHGVDGRALVNTLRSLDYAGAISVVDAAERYWVAAGSDD